MADILKIRQATIRAIDRTGDQYIGMQVKAGRLQVVRAVPVKGGRYDIQPLTDYLPIVDAIKFLDDMGVA